MTEHGMIFNAEMVRAILDGLKTQTRREVKLNLDIARLATTYDWATSLAANHYQGLAEEQIQQKAESLRGVIHPVILGNGQMVSIICPHGKPGDRIWVREAFRVHSRATDVATLVYKASERNSWTEQTHRVPVAVCNKPATPEKWTPSLHMPRWASRILLEITDVRVERLNAISEEDATAEGVPPAGSLLPDYPGTFLTPKGDFATAKVAFQRLWESIYGEESWKANSWVWVISFERIEGGAA
ncbi:hypothetical protein ACV16N_05930 [Escherichia coli]|uniref:hypothetical protein n=1 Tax=Enterobacteriaceae TaxID=543 RepID=UPI001FF44C70|nr:MULTISPECIES: hypothetical protein [Enterobacteriaceae]MDZ9875714.1 hypothetical protein [Escherichia coli]MEA0183794.1 hypothetical protein [Escherichia coli]MED8569436.1 hypothetical protein [Escherichia coli]MED8587710.1 hypothetical protein [Escherichia coli]MED8601536.1 hypothetical protein [Escherichia coli]